jgi:hypothetical protein
MAKAKFDIKTEATRQFYAGVGVTDRAVEALRGNVTGAQQRLADVQKSLTRPTVLRDQAITVVSARVDELSKDAKARRAAIEKRVAALQDEATDAYGDLVKRGETLVGRIRRQKSTQDTKRAASTTSAKAKTTKTQGTKATRTTARKTANTAKSTARKTSSRPKSSAKATATAAKKTASNATAAAADAAAKVGD